MLQTIDGVAQANMYRKLGNIIIRPTYYYYHCYFVQNKSRQSLLYSKHLSHIISLTIAELAEINYP